MSRSVRTLVITKERTAGNPRIGGPAGDRKQARVAVERTANAPTHAPKADSQDCPVSFLGMMRLDD